MGAGLQRARAAARATRYVDVALGDQLKDNDPRMPNRVLHVVVINDHTVRASDGVRVRQLDRSRIFAAGKPRRTGFTLLTKGGAP